MARPPANPEQLFDRPWQPGHPFRPRLSRTRRWGMLLLLLFFSAIIAGYWVLTDSNRVKQMAESYLSAVVGGPVEVGVANLSIFQGLRLENVTVYTSPSRTPDSVLFSAKTLWVRYDPRVMVRGKLEATQILAIEPRVQLTENLDTHKWNFESLVRESKPRPKTEGPERPPTLPETLLRSALIEYSQIKDGKFRRQGSMVLEGRLSPDMESDHYSFNLQSRGSLEGVGPSLSGSFAAATGQVNAVLQNFDFSRDIKRMLPAEILNWWDQHELAGRVNIPQLSWRPGKKGEKDVFRVEMNLEGVKLAVHPEEWLTRDEMRQLTAYRRTARMLKAAGLDTGGAVKQLNSLIEPVPIRLEDVYGTFVFNKDGKADGIDVQGVRGRLETNGFRINGRIGGYNPDATFALRVNSLETEYIHIPRAPRYLTSLPPDVRELYQHLRPEGDAKLWVELNRTIAGGRLNFKGAVDVVDGNFVFDLFPYPLRKATGRITFGPDPVTGRDRCDIQDLRGLGLPDGPNKDVTVAISGFVAPLDGQPEVLVKVKADEITAEPALTAAYPPEAQDAVKMFDAAGNGEFPKYHGSFSCDVHRPPGRGKKWDVDVRINLDDANGAFVFFPYPLEHVRGKLRIGLDHVDIVAATMHKGASSLVIDGPITFGHGRPLTPALTITARNVPMDKQLVAALPDEQRQWVEKLGIGGAIDIDGNVFRSDKLSHPKNESDIGYDLRIAMRDGTAWPVDGTFAVSALAGVMQLTPHQLVLSNVTGRRGASDISGSGTINWAQRPPVIDIRAAAKDLLLDTSLYKLLPESARRGWDAVRPQGTVDAELRYNNLAQPQGGAPPTQPVAVASLEAVQPPAVMPQPRSADPAFRLELRPRKLAVTPEAIPYRLHDVTGVVSIDPDKVVLKDLTARHGDASVAITGTGTLADRTAWDLQLAAENVSADDEFRKALPQALLSVCDALKVNGKLSFGFSKLVYRPGQDEAKATRDPATTPAQRKSPAQSTRPATSPADGPDVDFAVRILSNGTTMDVGVPLSSVKGVIDLAGTVRSGKLRDFSGKIDLPSLTMADRPVRNFRGELLKPTEHDALKIGKLQAELAGGEMAGDVYLAYPDEGPSLYSLNLVLHNADVRELAADKSQTLKGLLDASLAIEGSWSDPASRRGRGDVRVAGKDMYKIPVILGLLQITNLALPISDPFNEGTISYSVDGSRVTFEQIELRSNLMTMEGTGHLDFGTKKVKLTFVTDNPNAIKVPFLHDLFKGVRDELLQIHVNGTIQDPKITAAPMNTFTTTVDEVFKGSEQPAKKKKK